MVASRAVCHRPVHNGFPAERINSLLQGPSEGVATRTEIEKMLDLDRTRFVALLRQCRPDPQPFCLTCRRTTPARLPASAETRTASQLLRERKLVDESGTSVLVTTNPP